GSRSMRQLPIGADELLERNLEKLREKWGDEVASRYRKLSLGEPPVSSSAKRETVRADGRSDFDASPPEERPRVSLCMIVRNEEANIADCLETVRNIVDEIVIVDTGSTDATKSIAERFGARLFDFPWIDSFAAARNESLRHARCEWIFWMDADD